MKKTNDFTEGSQIIQSVMTVITKIAMGITVLVGQKIGEKRPHEAGIIGSGIATSVLAGLCLSYLFYTCTLTHKITSASQLRSNCHPNHKTGPPSVPNYVS